MKNPLSSDRTTADPSFPNRQPNRGDRQLLFALLATAMQFFMVLSLIAQTAHQGGPDPTEFHSPMILDTVFVPADSSLWRGEWVTSAEWTTLRRFHCDNVSIGPLSARGKAGPGDTITFEVQIMLSNRKGHDKEVTVRFEVLDGEHVAASAFLGPLQIDEAKNKTRSVKLGIPKGILRSDPKTPFRITVTARDI